MKKTLMTACLVLACTAAATAQDEASPWYADYDKAAAAAKEQGKDLFVDFTGSDWCGWCIKLDEEVFSHDDFLSPAQEMSVLVKLDYPRSDEVKAKVPNPERNDEIRKKYEIRGYPTCLLMTSDGTVFGNMGYQPEGPEKYIEDMRTNSKEGKRLLVEVKQLKADYAAAADKTAVVTTAVTMLTGMNANSIGLDAVSTIVMDALKLDADNKSGLKLKAIGALLDCGKANEEVQADAFKMDPKNESGLYEKVILSQFSSVRDEASAKAAVAGMEGLLAMETLHDSAAVKQSAATAASWCGMFKEEERGVELAKKADALEGELDERTQANLDKILGK